MSKEELKNKIREAIEEAPFRKDIKKASLFGSHAYGEPKEDSDVDILVEFMPENKIGFFELFDIQENIERRLNKKVDLLTPNSLSKYFREKVLKNAETIYER